MWLSVCHRLPIQFFIFVDLKWTRSLFFVAMILAVVLYTVTVLCQIANALPKLQSQVSNASIRRIRKHYYIFRSFHLKFLLGYRLQIKIWQDVGRRRRRLFQIFAMYLL